MSLRRRLTIMAALAVGVAVVGASVAAYLVVRAELLGQVDDALRAQGALVAGVGELRVQPQPGAPPGARAFRFQELRKTGRLPAPPQREGGAAGFAQIVTGEGRVVHIGPGAVPLPVDDATRDLAHGSGPFQLSTTDVRGNHLRLLTVHLPGGGALQLARSLDGIDSVLGRLRLILAAVAVAGIALAAALARWMGGRVIAPVGRLTGAVERVAATDDLSLRVGADGDDELGRLARRFDAMLEALQRSRAELDASAAAQRQLVADASHELRTPITSLRTNVELLSEGAVTDPVERRRLLADVTGQADELTALVADIVELARGAQRTPVPDDVRLDDLVCEAVARVGLHAPAVEVRTDLDAVSVEGVPDRLARALNNLLDNAVKHSPPGDPVEVTLRGGTLSVRDHGDGIPEEDLEHVFDRFHRGANARDRHGSGLGLAIVRQVAESHGGTVTARNATDGGAVFTLSLPQAILVAEPAPG